MYFLQQSWVVFKRFTRFRNTALGLIIVFIFPALASAYEFTVPLEQESTGADVVALQEILSAQGFYTNSEITGYFGLQTLQAVADFQRANGLPGLGYVGPQTRVLLTQLSQESQSPEEPTVVDVPPDYSSSTTSVPTVTLNTEPETLEESLAQVKALPARLSHIDANADRQLISELIKLLRELIQVLTKLMLQSSVGLITGGEEVRVRSASSGGGGSSSNTDITAPTVLLTSPTNGSTISGTVSMTANASDNKAVSGVQFKVDNTAIGSEDTSSPYSVDWDTTSFSDGSYSLVAVARDSAGNYATSSVTNVTVNNSVFDVADQTLSFGELTIANAGAVAPSANGGSISSASITSGNALGHWQVSSDGSLSPTATGDTADLNAGPYTLGVTVSDGATNDTAIITININDDTFDVRDRSELQAAVAAAEVNDVDTAYTIYVRNGVTIEGDSGDGDRIRIEGIEMNASLVDSNQGVTEDMYDYNARASFSGGSIHITSRTPYTASVDGQLRLAGSRGIMLSGLNFTLVAESDSFNRDDGGAQTDQTSANDTRQIYITKNVTYPAEPLVIIKSNRMGGFTTNESSLRWGHAVLVDVADQVIVEDNDINGFFIGVTFSSVNRGVARRNSLQNFSMDGLRAMNSETIDLADFTSSRIEFTSNVVFNLAEDGDWAGAHSDGIQIGSGVDQVDRDVLIKRNYLYLTTAPNSYPGVDTERRVTQGMYIGDTPDGVTIDGVVAENFVVSTARAGIALWRGVLEVRNNTLVKDTTHEFPVGNTLHGSDIRVREGEGHILRDNIVDGIWDEGGTFTAYDNVINDFSLSSGNEASYYDRFAGPFTVGPYGPSWSLETTSSSSVVNGLASIFSPQVDTLAETRGFTNGPQDRTPDALVFSDLTDQAVGTLVYANEFITGISENTFVTSTNLEWGVAATNDENDVVVWNNDLGIIDNNQYLHIRMTTSASDGTTVTGDVQVGSATTTWQVETAAGSSYVATAVEFDGSTDYIFTNSFSGASSSQGLISTWFFADEETLEVSQRLLNLRTAAGAFSLDLYTLGNNDVRLQAFNDTSDEILNFQTPFDTIATSTWHHLLISYDLSSASFHAYLNDTDLATAPITITDDAVSELGRAGVGAVTTGAGFWNGYMSDTFYDGSYLDLSIASNRRLFIDSDGKPVNLGSDGSTPLSSQPELFVTGGVASWHLNKGDGGDFTEVGELTEAPSSPSD